MAFTITVLVEAAVLILNAITILHEQRFLLKIGWAAPPEGIDHITPESSVKAKLMQILHAVRLVARVPLIIMNVLVIALLLVFG